jgi:hypothetical protein
MVREGRLDPPPPRDKPSPPPPRIEDRGLIPGWAVWPLSILCCAALLMMIVGVMCEGAS